MNIGETLYVTDREDWRTWLKENHSKKKEIWLVYFNKASGKKRIDYGEAVEEALCFGWIDSTVKKISVDSFAQRFTPRKSKFVSEPNRLRVKKMISQGRMTPAGLEKVSHVLTPKHDELVIPKEIMKELKQDPVVWRNFQAFPEEYKKIRIDWIAASKDSFKTRLNYFIKMTRKNKRYGMIV
ncbi:YdeI/OmpD-associated family protein [Candidatus Micrarchaeota archaeon]|nr:YdeI/OmpD-associated family protein [Candidatus Micrarchaeota archaeon]